MKNIAALVCLIFFIPGSPIFSSSQLNKKKPVYFHISHHQEAVGHPANGFPGYEKFKQDLKAELSLLDRYGAVSDQCFSDFIVSVILYMKESGRDIFADSIFTWFNNSKQNLGYHFHPPTWDIMIRLDKIKDMDLEEAIAEYTKWEQAYYDWLPCASKVPDTATFCGTLDTTRTSGMTLMQQYFKKPVVNEVLTIMNPAAGQVFLNKYCQMTQVVGQAGNIHTYYSQTAYQNLWMSDWIFATEPDIYVYKMMGLYFIQNKSEAWTEGAGSPNMMKQALNALPPDIPHIFAIHLTNPEEGSNALEEHLKYITEEYIPANQGSCFISTAHIPELVIPNPKQFTMEELEKICRNTLYNWHGRPPAFAILDFRYLSMTGLFKALQKTLQSYLSQTVPAQWPGTVTIPDFIWPPLGRESALPNDKRIMQDFPADAFKSAIRSLPEDNKIPYAVLIPAPLPGGSPPLQANAAEFLKGMCHLFLNLRQGTSPEYMNILSSWIAPISTLQRETSRMYEKVEKTNLDWLGDLQYWTLEPLRLKDEFPVHAKESYENNDPGFELEQNYPNPFSAITTIRFFIPQPENVSIIVTDLLGRDILILVHRKFNAGWHTVEWNGCDSSGKKLRGEMVLLSMSAGGYSKTIKAVTR